MIKPKHEGDYPDREMDLQEMIAGKLVEALDAAETAGWDRTRMSEA